jgi:hypothetical protein
VALVDRFDFTRDRVGVLVFVDVAEVEVTGVWLVAARHVVGVVAAARCRALALLTSWSVWLGHAPPFSAGASRALLLLVAARRWPG